MLYIFESRHNNMSQFVCFYLYYMILAGFDPALGLSFYFFSLKSTKKEKIGLIKSVQTDFLQTFITTNWFICGIKSA